MVWIQCKISSFPLVKRLYVESFIFYLDFATPIPHFKSWKLWKKHLLVVRQQVPMTLFGMFGSCRATFHVANNIIQEKVKIKQI